jgi:hypothetical protein
MARVVGKAIRRAIIRIAEADAMIGEHHGLDRSYGHALLLLAELTLSPLRRVQQAGAGQVAARGTVPQVLLSGRFTGPLTPTLKASFSELNGVYCTSASNCLAAGVLEKSGVSAVLNQALSWTGASGGSSRCHSRAAPHAVTATS